MCCSLFSPAAKHGLPRSLPRAYVAGKRILIAMVLVSTEAALAGGEASLAAARPGADTPATIVLAQAAEADGPVPPTAPPSLEEGAPQAPSLGPEKPAVPAGDTEAATPEKPPAPASPEPPIPPAAIAEDSSDPLSAESLAAENVRLLIEREELLARTCPTDEASGARIAELEGRLLLLDRERARLLQLAAGGGQDPGPPEEDEALRRCLTAFWETISADDTAERDIAPVVSACDASGISLVYRGETREPIDGEGEDCNSATTDCILGAPPEQARPEEDPVTPEAKGPVMPEPVPPEPIVEGERYSVEVKLRKYRDMLGADKSRLIDESECAHAGPWFEEHVPKADVPQFYALLQSRLGMCIRYREGWRFGIANLGDEAYVLVKNER
jgi:hypothetical protein